MPKLTGYRHSRHTHAISSAIAAAPRAIRPKLIVIIGFAPFRLMALLYRKRSVATTNYGATFGCEEKSYRQGTGSFAHYSFVTMGMIMGLRLVCLYR